MGKQTEQSSPIIPKSTFGRLVLGSTFSIILVVWITAFSLVSAELEDTFVNHAEEASRLAQFFETETVQIFHYADSYVKSVRREYRRNKSLDAVRKLIEEVPLDTTEVSHITIIDEVGTPILNTGYNIKPGSSAKDRDYFKKLKKAGEDRLYISLPHIGRNSGKVVVRLVRPIILANGEFGGVIFAAVEDKKIVAFFNSMNLDAKSSATLVGTDKKIRARSSYGRLGPGQDISGSRIWKELEKSPTGLYRQTSVVDGITRFYAYRKLPEYPLVAAIGIAVDDISGHLEKFTITSYGIALLVTIALGGLAALIRRERLIAEARDDALKEAERATKAKSEFMASMSHELRTPLNSILGFAGMMREQFLGPLGHDKYAEYAKDIVDSGQHLLDMVNDILDIERIEAGKYDLKIEIIDIPELLNECIQLHSLKADRGEVSLSVAVAGGLAPLHADRRALLQVLINLVTNAVRFTGKGGEVVIAVSASNGHHVFEVRDTGIGIPEEKIPTLTDPFTRHDTNPYKTQDGVGLGLAICKSLVELHGGELSIESELGKGTVVSMMLPSRAS